MARNNRWQLTIFDLATLLPILALAFYIAFIPHYNYPYPVHIDEWVHLARSEAMMRLGSTTFFDPLSGGSTMGLGSNLEAGFHLFWGIFQQITGVSWLTILRYFPSIIFMITVLSVYALTRREGFGWEAALFTCLIPTTLGILGPAFLVPVSMGLLFIPLSLLLVFNFKTWPSYLLLFIFNCFLLLMHPPSALVLFIVLIPYILLNLRGNFRHSLGITLALVIPFVAIFPWIFEAVLPNLRQLLTTQPPSPYVRIPSVIQAYGYLPIAFSFLGTVMLAIRGGKKEFGLIFGLIALLLMLVVFYTFHYGLQILYQRGLTYMMLMLSIIAGAGLAWVRTIRWPSKFPGGPKSFLARNVGNVLCLILIAVTLAVGIPDRQETRYYHMIDSEDYQAFVWIRDNVTEDYEKAILDPWKATAFAAITQKSIYTRIHEYPKPSDRKAYEFLNAGCTDTAFLKDNEISIVYSQRGCNNPDLVEVRSNVYLLSQAER